MAPIIRPTRKVSFASHAKGPLPVDMLDAQISNLIDAIHSTQEALADIRREDGQLKTPSQPPDVTRKTREIEQRIAITGAAVANAAAQFTNVARDIDLRARDAETAAFSAQHAISAVSQAGIQARDALGDAENAADSAENAAIASQNSANYSKAQADNAIAANVEATQWAEYLAGPVVNSDDAPAYISGHPFGHGLYYQPVEGYGGVGGLWSAKWWAVYAAQLVGSWSFYYLGSWSTPPVPGSISPDTGVTVPSPLAPGSFYYNTSVNQLYVWDGTQWNQPFVQVLTPGLSSSFVYVATAGQTVFSGPDATGKTPIIGIKPSDVHVSGLRLVYSAQYTVNTTTNSMTLVTPATAGQVVQWDLLSGSDVNVGVNIRKVTIAPVPDGIRTEFTMTYVDSGSVTQPVNITGGPQLAVSLDGVFQEPGSDFVASGNVLTMGAPPQVNSRFWGLWYTPGDIAAPPGNAPPSNVARPTISGSTTAGSTLTATVGGWIGTPSPTYAYQWKSAGANVGSNQNFYQTVTGDVTKTITVSVTATNSQGNATATSDAFGPIISAATTDSTPDSFTFVDQPNAATSTYYESNTITVTGIDTASPVTITGGEYSKNGGVFTAVATTALLNNTFKVRGISSASNSTATNVTLNIGGVVDTFNIITVAPADTTPDPYLFVDATGVALSTVRVSNTITVTGIDAPAAMTITAPGEYSVNSGTYANTATTVVVNDAVRVRLTSSASNSTAVSTTLTIGGVSDTFTVTTLAAPPLAPSLDLKSTSDTGTSTSDDITRDTTPDLTISFVTAVEAGDIVRLLDGATELTAHTITEGEISSSVISLGLGTLAGGSHSLTARHEKAGQVSPYSTALVFTIDIVQAVITTPATASVNEGVVLAIPLTASETVTWTKTFDSGNDFEISGTTLRWTANGTKAFTGTLDIYACEVTATDVAGNATAKSITVTVLDVVTTTRSFGAEGVGVTAAIGGRAFGTDGIAIVET